MKNLININIAFSNSNIFCNINFNGKNKILSLGILEFINSKKTFLLFYTKFY